MSAQKRENDQWQAQALPQLPAPPEASFGLEDSAEAPALPVLAGLLPELLKSVAYQPLPVS